MEPGEIAKSFKHLKIEEKAKIIAWNEEGLRAATRRRSTGSSTRLGSRGQRMFLSERKAQAGPRR
jgi:hypothetical protein